MILKTMWGQRAGENMPELMVAWDEYCVDSNERGFRDDCHDVRQSWGEDLVEWRMIDIHVPEEMIRHAFEPTSTAGVVVPCESGEG